MSAFGQEALSGAGHQYWLPTLQLAAQEVFSLMLGSALTVPPEPLPDQNCEITAIVGLAGKMRGILTVRCSTNCAARVASRMLGRSEDQVSQEMWDAIGEICNMVAGNFKNKISGLGDGCMLSVPTVIIGRDYNVHAGVNEELRASFLFENEPVRFCLEVHR